jgi:hypothetical protein
MEKNVWASGAAYEPYVGRWSRLVARAFVDWLSVSARARAGWTSDAAPAR